MRIIEGERRGKHLQNVICKSGLPAGIGTSALHRLNSRCDTDSGAGAYRRHDAGGRSPRDRAAADRRSTGAGQPASSDRGTKQGRIRARQIRPRQQASDREPEPRLCPQVCRRPTGRPGSATKDRRRGAADGPGRLQRRPVPLRRRIDPALSSRSATADIPLIHPEAGALPALTVSRRSVRSRPL